MTTNTILRHALGTLWPKNEPKPHFKAYPGEWCCTTGGDPCGYGPTLEEALYRYAIICQKYGDEFTPLVDYMGQFVEDPLILEDLKAVDGAEAGQK